MRLRDAPLRLFTLALTGLALSLWPVACASGAGGRSPARGVAEGDATPSAAAPPVRVVPHPALAHAHPATGAPSLADIAERAAPSVVNVASSQARRDPAERAPFFHDPFFRRFFGPGGPGPEPGPREGLGSGVIVSADGVVLTNNHVVEGADAIRVTTADKREYRAKVVGTDAKSDLAVLRLEGDLAGLRPLPVGDSARLRLGDFVLAIGNPFGVGQTITMGIVSAKGRANVGIAAYEDFIQTDAAINPGNSGGALVDMEGNLVGINTAILSRTGGSMGIGFAIPTNMASPIMRSLLEHGRVVRGWLGVGIQDVDQALAGALGLQQARGVLVSEAMAGSPGARAGLERGDVILTVNGESMSSTGQLRNAIAAAGAGKVVRLECLRDGKPRVFEVTLGELPDERGGAASPGSPGRARPPGLEGLTLGELDAGARERLGVPRGVNGGVLVERAEPGTGAGRSGLRPGDVIVEVGKTEVTSVAGFERAVASAKGPLLLRVLRDGRSLYVVLGR